MLERSGDLIPVHPEAVNIPWSKRRSLILDFLHRGPVDFATYVYDTNVGDVSKLSTYFNPDRWSLFDLNHKFGNRDHEAVENNGGPALVPRLLIYPEHNNAEDNNSVICPPGRKNSQQVG